MRKIFSLLLLLISAFYLSLSLKLEFISNGIPGGGFLPIITSILLVIMTGYNLVKDLRGNVKESYVKDNMKNMLQVILVTFFYVLLFNILGALLSTLLFTITILIFLNKGKWKTNFIFSIIVTTFVFFMFDYFLNTHLPKGIFENII
ncbi:MAG TPA: tripartite tricarboxylate transporter TctB family protein [Pseudogracilibacillus sp.]|nr:tripartite tricarboxylate transporter TctB family protein [Pseudogracilibacillus sp.]